MADSERRRAERHNVDLPGELLLSHGRRVPVRILNIGSLGALIEITDLEEALFEGERAVLDHSVVLDGRPQRERARTTGAIVRVELEFDDRGVSRHLAVYFDGGPRPDGVGD